MTSSSSNPSSSSPTSLDTEQYKIAQRQSWDSAASGWKNWWEVTEKGAQKINDRLVELAEIKPGQKVLDIATGIGEPAVTAAKVAGANGGHVLAIDISLQMLAGNTLFIRRLKQVDDNPSVAVSIFLSIITSDEFGAIVAAAAILGLGLANWLPFNGLC